MLKIGIESIGYFSYQKNEVEGLIKAKEHGYDCLDYGEFSRPDSVVLNLSMDKYEAYLRWLKKQADEVGIMFNQAHGLWFMDEKNLKEREYNIECYKKQIIGCSFLGCPNLVIHPCCPGGWIWSGDKMDDRQASFQGNMEVIKAILPTAKEYGVTICLENLPFTNYSLTHTADVKEIVSTICDANVKVCLDLGHANVMGEDLYETVTMLGDDLRCLHIHDNNGVSDLHSIPYCGNMDWELLLRGLKEINFQGVISLETVIPTKMPEPMKSNMQRGLADIARYFALKVSGE